MNKILSLFAAFLIVIACPFMFFMQQPRLGIGLAVIGAVMVIYLLLTRRLRVFGS